MSTPERPAYRDDPDWQAAMQEYLADIDGENDTDRILRGMRGALRLQEIEAPFSG